MNNYLARYKRPTLKETLQYAGRLVGKVHPICKTLPIISQQDFDNLVDSIMEHGLIVPIFVNRNNQLLDGRARLMACCVAGVTITADQVYVTEHSPDAIAQSNIARRHLPDSYKPMSAAERLARYRMFAAKQQAASMVNGRKNQQRSDEAKLATSPHVKKRGAWASEKADKEESVPRADLVWIEKFFSVRPDLKALFEAGGISHEEIAEIAGVPYKQLNAATSKRQPPTRQRRTGGAVLKQQDVIRRLKISWRADDYLSRAKWFNRDR